MKGKGRILLATRDIKPLDLVLVDPGTVIGPNYRSRRVCLECLKLAEGSYTCEDCDFPLCDEQCYGRERHRPECTVLKQLKGTTSEFPGYACVTVLRLLLLSKSGSDEWQRTDKLMDHLSEKNVHPQEWLWYQTHIIDFIRNDLKLGDMFPVEQIERAIGLLNVNAVCLQFPRVKGTPNNEVGKGIYPIFAIMSHECVCNTRYVVDPNTFNMYVRARVAIKAGEELTVQYLSALWGNFKRRKKIREEWFFDCTCRRCSDRTECQSYVSGVKCFVCLNGTLLPRNSLDYDSEWFCSRCDQEVCSSRIETLVQGLETEFNSILDTEEYWKYKDIIDKYSGTVLHPSHWILTTARRNLIQYLCYSNTPDFLAFIDTRGRYKLCEEFWSVLKKIDPGWSELSMFVLRELHFSKLSVLQTDYAMGVIPLEEFSVKSRNSIDTLDKIIKEKEFLIFDDKRDVFDTEEELKIKSLSIYN